MTQLLIDYLPWVLSAITVWKAWIAGDKSDNTWIVGILNQLLWFVWIVASKNYGLLPMALTITVIYVRNHFKWKSSAS